MNGLTSTVDKFVSNMIRTVYINRLPSIMGTQSNGIQMWLVFTNLKLEMFHSLFYCIIVVLLFLTFVGCLYYWLSGPVSNHHGYH